MHGVGDLAAEVVGVTYGQSRVHPAFNLKAQASPGPPGAGVGVLDSVDGGGTFGGDEHTSVHAIE